MVLIKLTDANYGNDLYIRPDRIDVLTISAETVYREGRIPDGVVRRTLVYTTGGNQVSVRETPEEIKILCMKAGCFDGAGGN